MLAEPNWARLRSSSGIGAENVGSSAMRLARQLLQRGVRAGVVTDASGHPPEGVARAALLAKAVETDSLGPGARGMDGGHGAVDVAVARLVIVGGMAVVVSRRGCSHRP